MQSVLLIGGMFGSGKTTLASGICDLYGSDSYNIDFANIYRDVGGEALSQSEKGDAFRDSIWADQLSTAIDSKLAEGFKLVVANSSFLISGRRRAILERIDQDVNIVPLILAIPIRTSHHRIKASRPFGTHPVNMTNSRESIMRMCRSFITGDNSDILLPSILSTLSPEYLAMLNRSKTNRAMLYNTHQDEAERMPQWIMIPDSPTPERCVELIKLGITDPFLIRKYFENTKRIEPEGELPRIYRR